MPTCYLIAYYSYIRHLTVAAIDPRLTLCVDKIVAPDSLVVMIWFVNLGQSVVL